MTRTNRKGIWGKSLFSILFLIFCEWFFFRNMYGTPALFGDAGDGRLTMLIAEHWLHVFQREARIADLGMFYPAQNTLAYSDMLFGYGLLHSVLRVMGLNVYLSFKYTILLVHVIGTISCYWLLRKTLRMDEIRSLIGTVAFSFSDTYVVSFSHPQLCALSFLPLAVILAVCFFRNVQNRKKRNVYAYLCISMLMLVLYTSWYMAFFSAVFVATGCATGLLFCSLKRISIQQALKEFFREVRFDLIGYVLFTVAALIPFAILELPIMKMSSGYNVFQIWMYIPEPVDVVHVSHSNWMLGSFFESIPALNGRNLDAEVIRGFSIVLFGLFLFFLIRSFVLKQKGKELAQIIALTVIVSILLTIQWHGPAYCGWRLINKLFPGGRSVRAIARYFIFLNFPMSVAAVCLWNLPTGKAESGTAQKKTERFVSLMLLFMILLSNVNKVGASTGWDAVTAERRMTLVSEIPEDCESFYIIHAAEQRVIPDKQLDAYEISDRYGVPTLNGYSGVFPPGWGLWNIDDEDYFSNVENWVREYNLENVYAYSQVNNQWIKHR